MTVGGWSSLTFSLVMRVPSVKARKASSGDEVSADEWNGMGSKPCGGQVLESWPYCRKRALPTAQVPASRSYLSERGCFFPFSSREPVPLGSSHRPGGRGLPAGFSHGCRPQGRVVRRPVPATCTAYLPAMRQSGSHHPSPSFLYPASPLRR
jgi:hypothetical protein